VGVLQRFPLSVEVGLTTLEPGLMGAQDLKLATKGDVVQLFPLQQLSLPLLQLPLQPFYISHSLVDLACAHGEVLLFLDDGVGPGLDRCVQLLHVSKGPLGVGVALGDGLHL
jgi:hypothetical protein